MWTWKMNMNVFVFPLFGFRVLDPIVLSCHKWSTYFIVQIINAKCNTTLMSHVLWYLLIPLEMIFFVSCMLMVHAHIFMFWSCLPCWHISLQSVKRYQGGIFKSFRKCSILVTRELKSVGIIQAISFSWSCYLREYSECFECLISGCQLAFL